MGSVVLTGLIGMTTYNGKCIVLKTKGKGILFKSIKENISTKALPENKRLLSLVLRMNAGREAI